MPPQPSPSRSARISLAFVGLMWVLPFLYYRHAYPLTTFYQEWGAAMLGLCAMPVLVSRRFWQQPEIPRVALLPVGLMLVVLAQLSLGKVAYFDQALLLVLYLLWVVLLIVLGHRLREEIGLPALAGALAVFLLLGAELSALVGVLQHFRWRTPLDTVVVIKISAAVYGNLAQPNHFADYVTLGLASLGLLFASRRLRAWQAALLAAPLLFVLALSGSRSAWLYLSCMAALAFLWQRRDKQCLPLLRYSLLLLLGFALMNALVQLPLFAAGTSTAQRLIEGGTGNSIRLYLWREAWLIFAQFPLLGAGFGQFAWQHFQLGPELRATYINGLYNNAHNFVFQLAAATGLAGLLVLLGTLALWFRQARAAPRSIYHWWGFALLAVLAIHSLLEYPLWYAYFLGVAAFALGAMDSTTYRLELRGAGRWSVAAMLLLGLLSLFQLIHGYRNLEGLTAMRPASAADDGFSQRLRDGLGEVYQQSLLHPYAEMLMSGMVEASPDHLAEKRALNGNVMRFVPISPVVYREAYLLALSGEPGAAKRQLERAIWSYPGDFPSALEKLRELARNDPAHFAALLEFALQKNEERQHAILPG
ncbi:MAG: O-antigen ligase C-terminal domain-containing protein [Nitrosomonadales bacterium]|nr:O-antigen ligase C-terminal domain-containing protein [Nitrosomonadales bacterium]